MTTSIVSPAEQISSATSILRTIEMICCHVSPDQGLSCLKADDLAHTLQQVCSMLESAEIGVRSGGVLRFPAA